MVISKKMTKEEPFVDDKDIENIINKGGSTTAEIEVRETLKKETKFTLRVPPEIVDKLDKERNSRVGNISRHQLILELISKGLK